MKNLRNSDSSRIVVVDESSVEKHTCGTMMHLSKHCFALHFEHEKSSDGGYRNCCHKGKVILKPRPAYPLFLIEMSSKGGSGEQA